uniref:EOG090X02D0 n=1 Tax=Alona affinis TaxID=381656 RepID=A0A9N6ZEC8_9CRUS|nr:EOG090X02D0 [Alona affinis]
MSSNLSSRRSRKKSKTEICRLISPKPNPAAELPSSSAGAALEHPQPLNLCVRDGETCVRDDEISSRTAAPIRGQQHPAVRQRRKKRSSAIFSIPNEKLAKNDVSICKFKFVSGMQPRLQDKKILSLDSAGAFRFFPESSSKPSGKQLATSASSTAAKPVPALLPIEAVRTTWSNTTPSTSSVPTTAATATSPSSGSKKLSRRQKMEQTFGEKGFLIQTQHVPAHEGSAFCKFRQLKKFTRYLYRSWRHYLPEEETAASIPSSSAAKEGSSSPA